MLRLRNSVAARQVVLGKIDPKTGEPTVWIKIRPATQFEVEETHAEVWQLLAGIAEGSDAAQTLGTILGEDFDVSGLADRAKLNAAASRLAGIYLVMACQEGWWGIADEGGKVFEKPEPATVALLLKDPGRNALIMAAINAGVHVETEEGNASPALPSGGAGIRDGAPPVGNPATPAQTASASGTRTVN